MDARTDATMHKVRNVILSDAVTRIVAARGLPVMGDVWLAVRAWIDRPPPRRDVEGYVRDVLRRARRESRQLVTFDASTLDVESRDEELLDTGLSPRDARIAEWVAAGWSYREISAKLGVSPASIARRVARIRGRLKCST